MLRAWLGVFLILSLMGCGGDDGTPATIVQVNLTASEKVNPDGEGRPSPIVVKVFLLDDPDRFEAADFFSLFKNAQSVLGDDLQSEEEFRLLPGMRQSFIKDADDDVEYLGVVAAYRDIDHAIWRGLVAVPEHETSQVEVILDRLAVKVDLIRHW